MNLINFSNKSSSPLPIDRLKEMSQIKLLGGTKISLVGRTAYPFDPADHAPEAALVVKGLTNLGKIEFLFGNKPQIKSLGSGLENEANKIKETFEHGSI